ncbi:UNVERIFIED_CONTAM: hypothetical protein GTU68_046028 [Idotea baltica]|nr:hypothetical protein [Idotea baltica]
MGRTKPTSPVLQQAMSDD